jgi:spore germination protein Q
MSQYYNQQGQQAYPYRQQGAQPYQGQGYYPQQPAFPQFPPAGTPATPPPQGGGQSQGMLPIEQSYIENILRLNKGKLVTVHATYEGNSEWNAKIFKGIIEAAGRDHLILSDPQTGQRYLIPMVAFDYAVFDEELDYEYPFGAGPSLGTYPPR